MRHDLKRTPESTHPFDVLETDIEAIRENVRRDLARRLDEGAAVVGVQSRIKTEIGRVDIGSDQTSR